jgi:peptide/nickel transport system permease protein
VLRYIAKRLLIMVPTLIVISFLVFFIMTLPPGNCVTAQIDEILSSGGPNAIEKVRQLEQLYDLDKPWFHRYLIWAGGALTWDFGLSCQDNQPVGQLIGERIALTMVMEISTIIFIWVVSFIIGVYAATHQYRPGDYIASFIGFIGLATPNFLLALVLLYVGKRYFGVSVGGLMDPQYIDAPWTWGKVQSILEHLIIPVIVIGTAGTAGMIRRLRANLLDELNKQYVVTGRAKGLPPGRLLVKYPLRISLNPFIADIGSLLPELISGSVIVSVVMSLPLTGPMLLDALRSQDMYLAGSFLMFMAFLTVVGVFISDILLALLDPRIRLGAGASK